MLLLLCQIRTRLQYAITLRNTVETLEFTQYVHRKGSRSGTELDDVTTSQLQDLSDLARYATAKQWGYFWCRNKIAGCAKLLCTRGVITESGRMQGQIHEHGKRNPPAFGRNPFANVPEYTSTMLAGIIVWRWQAWIVHLPPAIL